MEGTNEVPRFSLRHHEEANYAPDNIPRGVSGTDRDDPEYIVQSLQDRKKKLLEEIEELDHAIQEIEMNPMILVKMRTIGKALQKGF
jgi:hypothetical protein